MLFKIRKIMLENKSLKRKIVYYIIFFSFLVLHYRSQSILENWICYEWCSGHKETWQGFQWASDKAGDVTAIF